MGVAEAIAGSALVGAGASLYGANRQASATDKATKTQGQMYAQQRQDFAPYQELGTYGVDAYRRAMSGENIKTYDPSYSRLDNAAAARYVYDQIMSGKLQGSEDFLKDVNNGESIQNRVMRDNALSPYMQNLYRDASGNIVTQDKVPVISNKPWSPTETPAYQWQQAQIDKNMNRQLAARGRSNSTYGMNSLANAYGNLGVQEYQNAYNRLLDPIKIGQGAANSAGQAAQAYGTNLSAMQMQQGQNQASLYSGLGALPMNAVGLGIRAGAFGGGSPYESVNAQDYTNRYGTMVDANGVYRG